MQGEQRRPPLDLVALFAADRPPPPDGDAGGGLPFRARRLDPRAYKLSGHLDDACQPVTPAERAAAAAARSALLLQCDADLPPAERLPGGLEMMRRLYAQDAAAVVLPAAHKIVGPAAFAALAPHLAYAEGWLRLFLQLYTVHDDRHAWCHTHGMEHFGLPDLECRVPVAEVALGERLVLSGIHHLLADREPLRIGDLVAAEDEGDRLLSCVWVRPARAVPGHDFGAYGALQLVPDPRPDSRPDSRPDPGPTAEEAAAPTTRASTVASVAQGQRLHDLDLHEADLRGCNLAGMGADRLDLRAADLRHARLAGSRLSGCRLEGARLEGADCTRSTLRACTLDNAQAAGARFDGARIEDGTAHGADLSRASLRGAHLSETAFTRAVLRNAVLDDVRGDGAGFRGADLGHASLARAVLAEADFRGADLRDADLSGGRFRNADFRGARLENARFDGADVTNALFDAGPPPSDPAATPPDDDNDHDSDDAPVDLLAALVAILPRAAGNDAPAATLLHRFQQAASRLDLPGHAPPEAWRPWLERLMNDETTAAHTLATLREATTALGLADLQPWLDLLATGADATPGEDA